MEIGYDIDTVAPTAVIDDVQVSGNTAKARFSSPAGDVARYECRLDDGAYATCTSPKQLSGLAPGSHTVRARAVDTTGNVGAAAEKGFTIAAPPSDPPPSHGDDTPPPPATGGSAAADTTAPRIALASKTLRVSKSGKVALKLRCPAGETRCSRERATAAGPQHAWRGAARRSPAAGRRRCR